MRKIKHTKTELKTQREALARYERFLPMLQLKKQQLQNEILTIDGKLAVIKTENEKLRSELKTWVKLFSRQNGFEDIVILEKIITEEGNIAGVGIPLLADVVIEKKDYDLFESPAWHDDAAIMTEKLIRLRVEREILETQRRLIGEELRITSQRVNLFEKIKIPECKENIRIIKIFLGDEQTAGVVRSKIAKARTVSYEYEEANV